MNMPTNTKFKASTISAVILALISGIILIASIVALSSSNDETPSAGPMAITMVAVMVG